MTRYHYIVVGAGSAGCVLANRLSENPAHRVLLVEAGPEDTSPLIAMPKGFGKLLQDPHHAHFYPVKPHEGNGHRDEVWARGKMLGGSSSINGMVYMRGHPDDYDGWERDHGATGWGWRTLSGCFRRIEDHALGADDVRGAGGPLKVSVYDRRSQLTEAVIAAAAEVGLRTLPDINRPDHEGVAYLTYTMRRGVRQSAASAFLKPARQRPNLTVITDSRVRRVLFEQQRAVGIEVSGPSGVYRVAVEREVILSAGALESPKLLQLSGIGDAAHLQDLGIPVVAHRPAVGRNLREHLLYMAQWRLRDWASGSENRQYAGLRLGLNVLRYLATKAGVLGIGTYPVGGFFRATPEATRPDAQIMLAPLSLDFSAGMAMQRFPGFQLFTYGLRPQSQGVLRITSADPALPPEIDPNYLSHPVDRQVAIGSMQLVRRMAATPALAHLIAEETRPGPACRTDDDLLDAFRKGGQSGYHACGTCRMGGDPDSVVDPQLNVRGVHGLRVMDLSVTPTMVSGNTNGPMMAMAWHAADLILRGTAAPAPQPPMETMA